MYQNKDTHCDKTLLINKVFTQIRTKSIYFEYTFFKAAHNYYCSCASASHQWTETTLLPILLS